MDPGRRRRRLVAASALLAAWGKLERVPELAAELVRLNVDVIMTGGNPVIAAVKQAT
jgi:hypothetical protein